MSLLLSSRFIVYDKNLKLGLEVTDKVLQYHTDYDNRPANVISFMPDIAGTSGSLQSEFVSLLFLQSHTLIGKLTDFLQFQ
jgi:hypothetical protein